MLPLKQGIRDSQIVIIMDFVIVSSVVIKKVVCKGLFQFHQFIINNVRCIKRKDTLSGEAALSKLFLSPSKMGCTLKGKYLLPVV